MEVRIENLLSKSWNLACARMDIAKAALDPEKNDYSLMTPYELSLYIEKSLTNYIKNKFLSSDLEDTIINTYQNKFPNPDAPMLLWGNIMTDNLKGYPMEFIEEKERS